MHARICSGLSVLIVATCAIFFAATPAKADDFGKRFTISVAPNYDGGTTSDQTAGPPPGNVCLGCTHDNPNPQDLKLDYGLDFAIDPRTHLNFSHSNLDFALGRILTVAPHLSLLTGTIADRTDTISLQHAFGHGLAGSLYYFNHVRQDVTGLCLNQAYCTSAQLGPPHPAIASVAGNPSSIDEHGYGLHLGYTFGPNTQIGQLFTIGGDAKYIPRSTTPPTLAPNLGGLGKYVGSQWIFPYSFTTKVPIFPGHTTIPLLGYERADVLFRDEATPEVYNVIIAGIVKVISKNATLSITNLHFNGCKCADTVPPPDNVRFSVIQVKLDLHTGL
jgi:hypothetical protein